MAYVNRNAPTQPQHYRDNSRLGALARLRQDLAAHFGDARLTIELVPETCWYSNVRTQVSPAAWDRLRKPVYRRAQWKCEICGGRGPAHPVECHEIWEYNDDARVQRLAGLVALCPNCHRVKHLGRSHLMGTGDAALAHVAAVNRWSMERTDAYADLVFEVWRLRSAVSWQLDVRWLGTRGIAWACP